MEPAIRNIEDLRAEIARLKDVERLQCQAIAKRFSTWSAVFSTIGSIFPKAFSSGEGKSIFETDIVSLLSRIILPFTLNKTIFRHSNFIIKTLVSLASQKVSNFINEETVTNLWDKVKGIFQRKEEEVPEHRAIPALSESY